MNKIRYGIFTIAIFIVLVAGAMNVAPALADDSTPPPTEPVSTETPPAEETGEVVDPAAAAAEALPASEEPAPVSGDEAVTVAEVIGALPGDTELVVVNESGEALPLASEEAAEIIYNGDPLWCPAGVAPKPGLGGCSPAFTSFTNDGGPDNGLIDWLYNVATPAGVSKAGVIWVEHNYAPIGGGETGPIVIDGAFAQGTMENFALTITGGWVGGTTGSTAINTTTPYSTFNVPLQITSWLGAITINNVLVTGASGANISALEVHTAGNITLNNVDAVNNTTEFGGAYLKNSTGTGSVTVNDSTFNNNSGVNSTGLEISSKGSITLKNVTANSNNGIGAIIDNKSALTAKAVTLNGTNHFSYNNEGGLNINTQGVITLNNITAMGNTGGHGVYLDNCDFNFGTDDCDYAVSSGVTIKGTNNFSDNGWDGLRVWSSGAISLNNITANGNGTNASRLVATVSDAYDAGGKGVFVNNLGSLKAITFSGTNTFNNNASNGITAVASGLLTVSNITANSNGCNIAYDTDTSYCAGAYLLAFMGINQTGYGRFSSNAQDGLDVGVFSKGAVTLNNLFADANLRDGVRIGTLAVSGVNVTLNGINVFTHNAFDGLDIVSDGVITLNNLTADGNIGGFGVTVDNSNAATPKAVTIKGAGVFSNNGQAGLEVHSLGAITTNGITAVGNTGGNGAFLDNCINNAGTCDAPAAQPITMNGNNFFDGNGGASDSGLYIQSRGAVTINNLTATYSGYDGARIHNNFSNAVGAVTIKGYAYFANNQQSGLNIISNGAVTLANITASININGYGLYIDNDVNSAVPVNVTITGNNIFNTNGSGGLAITTFGTVLLNNLTANGNTGNGVNIDVNNGTLARSVILNGNNTFNGNTATGLYIESLGAIKVNNVMANNNTGASSSGAELLNNDTIENQSITITGYGVFKENGFTGLTANSNGSITLANITATGNVSRGADIDAQYNNLTNTTFANVTITGVNTFNDNGLVGNVQGLRVFTDGNITLSNITANDNGSVGAYLNNDLYANDGITGIRTVTVSGVNMFNGNDTGLEIHSNGTVSLTRITANNNDNGASNGTGLLVFTDGAINLTCGSMYGNTDFGYYLDAGAGKIITIKGVFTFLNGIVNFTDSTPVITRTCPLP